MNRSIRACQRLAAVAVIVVLACIFACRPAWSPDGKRLLFTAVDDGGRFVACYDTESGKVQRVMVPPPTHDSLNAMWSPDGKRAVVLSGGGRGKLASPGVTEVLMTKDAPAAPRTWMLSSQKGGLEPQALVGSVVVGRKLFLSAGDIVRVDLDTRETKNLAAGRGERLAVARRGDGLCYVSYTIGKNLGPNGAWEVGSLDPVSMQRTALLKSTDFPGVDILPRPSFSPDLERIAMLDQKGASIIVFREGKIEFTLPIGSNMAVAANDLAWSRHGDKIYATVSRLADAPESGNRWSLVESTIGGSMQRETALFTSKAGRTIATPDKSLGLAISPDGKTAAVTTGYLHVAAEDHGLYLVDLTHAKRTVTKVAFPKSQTLSMRGSDTMLYLGKRWSEQFRVDHPGHVVNVSGGGSGTGFAALIAGDIDLAMVARQPKQVELDVAQENDVTLQQHRVVRNVAAICVHKDSPIESLTIAQLVKVFGAGGVTKWTELGFDAPDSDNDIIMATRKRGTASYGVLRSAALAYGPFAHSRITPQDDDVLIEFAALKKGAIVAVDDPAVAERNSEVKILAIARDDGSKPVLPTDATIADGSYPLAVSMFVYSRQDTYANSSRFLKWLRSDVGSQLTAEFGFRPAK